MRPNASLVLSTTMSNMPSRGRLLWTSERSNCIFEKLTISTPTPSLSTFFAVDCQREPRMLRCHVRHGRGEISHRAEKFFAGRRAFHDGCIVSCARDDGKSEQLSVARFDFADVEVHHATFACHLREGVRFGRGIEVHCEKVGGSCRKGHDRNAGVGKLIADRGDGSVAACGDHGVEFIGIVEERAKVARSVCGAYRDLIPRRR